MTPTQSTVLRAYAGLAALYTPCRDPLADSWPAVHALRRRYPSSGLRWSAGGSKEAERTLSEAVACGWLVRRRAASRTVAVRLTRAGITEAWRSLGYGPYVDMVIFEEVLRHGPAGSWIAETVFNDGRGWGDGHHQELVIVEATNLPALCTGLVESNATLKGHTAYRATDAPRPLAPLDWRSTPEPEADPAALDLYGKSFGEALTWLSGLDAVAVDARGEVGALPLSPDRLVLKGRPPARRKRKAGR